MKFADWRFCAPAINMCLELELTVYSRLFTTFVRLSCLFKQSINSRIKTLKDETYCNGDLRILPNDTIKKETGEKTQAWEKLD